MARGNIILKVGELKKTYGPMTIVKSFGLKAAAGGAVAFTSHNGAGKSTMLRCLVGADRPDEDTAKVLGVRMKETSPEIHRSVAMVTNDLDSFPDLSVVGHLGLPARAHEITDPDDLVDEIFDEVQFVSQAGQLPSTLSSGQRRRLALATVLVRPQRLLVLDEPEQRPDVEGVERLGTCLKVELQDDLAIVLTSHEPSLLAAIGAREIRLGERR